MRELGDHARDHQKAIVRRDSAQDITDDKDRHQADERRFTAKPCRGDSHDGRANGDAQCVTADQPAGCGNRHGQVTRHIWQQPHDDEFGGANGKSAQR